MTVNSMIPYLTASETATALVAATSVKQENLVEQDIVVVPANQPSPSVPHQSMQSIQSIQTAASLPMGSASAYLSNTLMSNQNVVSPCSPEVPDNKAYLSSFASNLASANNTVENNVANSMQPMLCHQDMNLLKQTETMVNQQAQLNAVLNNPYNSSNESVLVGGNSNTIPSIARITSMETNPMSFANLNHSIDHLKVDTLTINDKGSQLPQLSLTDINNQLSMSSATTTSPTNINMIPINSVMVEKSVLYPASDVTSRNVPNQLPTSDPMTMASMNKSTNLSANVGPLMETLPTTAGSTVIMGPTNFNPSDAKCSNGMIGANFGSIKATSTQLINLPQNEYMNQSGMMSGLKSALSPSSMINPMNGAQSVVTQQQAVAVAQAQVALAQAQAEKVNANIESFIQNMTNENIVATTQTTEMTVNSLLNTSSISAPSQQSISQSTFLNTSLIPTVLDCNVSNGSNIINTTSGMISHQPTNNQQNDTGVIISGPSSTAKVSINSNQSNHTNQVMMDTLPSSLNTTANTHPVCTTATVINSLGHTLESVTLPGQRGPIQFTDNVEMTMDSVISTANQVTVTEQSLASVGNGRETMTLAGAAHQYMSGQSMITSDQSDATTTGIGVVTVVKEAHEQAGNNGGGSNASISGLVATRTVLANHQMATVHHQQQQQHQQQHTTNIHTMSNMSDAELINFINPATFE